VRHLILLILPTALFAQQFEVAAIKPAPSQPEGHVSIRMSVDNARLLYTNVSLRDILKQAYKLQDDQITGPPWLVANRFDIQATIPADVPKDQVPKMLQNLLAQRFGVTLHHETKELIRYTLTLVPNGPKLKTAETSTGVTGNNTKSRNTLSGKMTMEQLTDALASQLARPVIDQTGLTGNFEISLQWASDNATDPDAGPTLLTAVQEQLGLKLSAGKGPVEILVIDHAEKAPTAN
jgi:uncharacterized protein (TIGR03435 family)